MMLAAGHLDRLMLLSGSRNTCRLLLHTVAFDAGIELRVLLLEEKWRLARSLLTHHAVAEALRVVALMVQQREVRRVLLLLIKKEQRLLLLLARACGQVV